jgi:hypothetical protein
MLAASLPPASLATEAVQLVPETLPSIPGNDRCQSLLVSAQLSYSRCALLLTIGVGAVSALCRPLSRASLLSGSDGVWTRLTPPARRHGPPVRSWRAGGASLAQPLAGFHN